MTSTKSIDSTRGVATCSCGAICRSVYLAVLVRWTRDHACQSAVHCEQRGETPPVQTSHAPAREGGNS